MATLTIRLPDDQHERLKRLAARRGTSLNMMVEEFSVKALAEPVQWTSGRSSGKFMVAPSVRKSI